MWQGSLAIQPPGPSCPYLPSTGLQVFTGILFFNLSSRRSSQVLTLQWLANDWSFLQLSSFSVSSRPVDFFTRWANSLADLFLWEVSRDSSVASGSIGEERAILVIHSQTLKPDTWGGREYCPRGPAEMATALCLAHCGQHGSPLPGVIRYYGLEMAVLSSN